MNTHEVGQLAWERMVTAVEKGRDRLRRTAQALEQAQIPYAIRDDKVDIRDMIDVGLIDVSFCGRLSTELAQRLQSLLNDPNG